jgi:hypothetical protein
MVAPRSTHSTISTVNTEIGGGHELPLSLSARLQQCEFMMNVEGVNTDNRNDNYGLV